MFLPAGESIFHAALIPLFILSALWWWRHLCCSRSLGLVYSLLLKLTFKAAPNKCSYIEVATYFRNYQYLSIAPSHAHELP